MLVDSTITAHAAVPTAAVSGAAATLTIVDVPLSRWIPRWLVMRKMRAAVPQYQRLGGLAYKLFTLSREGSFGGIYFWASRQQAQAWFTAAWFERVRRQRGVEGRVRYFQAPLVVDTTPGGTTAELRASAVATLHLIERPGGVSHEDLLLRFERQTQADRTTPGLLRKACLIGDDGTVGAVYLWRDQAHAQRFVEITHWEKSPNAWRDAATVEWFDAPILMPSLAPSTAAARAVS